MARKASAYAFLTEVGGLTYLPDGELAVHINARVRALHSIHRAMNNFYNEPAAARELRRLVPDNGQIPAAVSDALVWVVSLCYVGRPSGVANAACPAYREKSIMVATKLPFEQWAEFIASPSQAVAIADRLMHDATILRFSGKPGRLSRDISGAPIDEDDR